MQSQHLNVMIAETLEKLQHINPDLYGEWYSKLYAPHGDTANWNVSTLDQLNRILHQLTTMTAQSPNNADLFALKENYINLIIDGMDVDQLAQMAYDLLLDAYEDCTWDQVTEEIVDLYDEDTLVNLLPMNNDH